MWTVRQGGSQLSCALTHRQAGCETPTCHALAWVAPMSAWERSSALPTPFIPGSAPSSVPPQQPAGILAGEMERADHHFKVIS